MLAIKMARLIIKVTQPDARKAPPNLRRRCGNADRNRTNRRDRVRDHRCCQQLLEVSGGDVVHPMHMADALEWDDDADAEYV